MDFVTDQWNEMKDLWYPDEVLHLDSKKQKALSLVYLLT